MNLLALDFGTSMGYAMVSNGNILSGVLDLKSRRYEGGGMRYLKFQRWLDELHAAAPLEEVVFEEVRRHIGTDAAHVYGGLLGVMSSWCEKHKVPYEGIPVATIKKFVTGRGNADKEEMMQAVKKRWKITPATSDEADAYGLLQLRRFDVMN